jgi:aspartate/methionine/tyrosine aminotransferase
MTLKVSNRAAAVAPFIVMDVMRAANARRAQGHDIVHLEVGQPSTPAPQGALRAAQAALLGDRLGYVEAFGIPALRERIAQHYRAAYGLDLPVERVVVTPGSSGGFLLSFLAAFDVGDRVALAAPGYPAYRNILAALGLQPVDLPTTADHNFQPTVELLRQAGKLDGLIVASPSNPTGTTVSPAELRALAEYCTSHGIRLISDEIYHGIVYEGETATAAALSDSAIVINSFSKYFSMTGWRVGWMVLPADMLRAVECLSQNMFISTTTISQHAALAAFDCGEELDGHVRRYRANRDLLLDGLPSAGLDRLTAANGAFYIYADVSHLTNDSPDFCRRMLLEAGVACTPGLDFDTARGNGTLRISFAGATEEMAEAVRRLRAWRR